MSIKDVIKKSFLEGMDKAMPSLGTIIFCLVAALIIGCYIFLIYRIVTSDAFYSKNFNISLILITVITASIILTIQSSVIVSLGMVGALSIVRFRTAVKDPLDLVFLFWAISGGIIAGTNMIVLAIAVSAIITVVLVIYCIIPKSSRTNIYLSVNAEESVNLEEVRSILSKADPFYKIQSRNLAGGGMTFTAEMRLKEPDELMKSIKAVKGVISVSAVSNSGNTL